MANTKTKKAKKDPYDIYPLRVREESEWEKHVVSVVQNEDKNSWVQSLWICNQQKERHEQALRTSHDGYAKADSKSEEDWEQFDPGTLSDVVSETPFKTFPLVTKKYPTTPDAVYTPEVDEQAPYDAICTRSI